MHPMFFMPPATNPAATAMIVCGVTRSHRHFLEIISKCSLRDVTSLSLPLSSCCKASCHHYYDSLKSEWAGHTVLQLCSWYVLMISVALPLPVLHQSWKESNSAHLSWSLGSPPIRELCAWMLPSSALDKHLSAVMSLPYRNAQKMGFSLGWRWKPAQTEKKHAFIFQKHSTDLYRTKSYCTRVWFPVILKLSQHIQFVVETFKDQSCRML